MSKHDVIILGGGVIGAALAEELSRYGKRVALVDRGRIGAEASSSAAGILASQMDIAQPDAFFDLCQASRRLYPRWVEQVQRRSGIGVGYSVDGALYVAMRGREEVLMDRRIRWQLKRGLKVRRLSSRDARRLYPAVDGRIKRAYFFPTEAQIDSARLMQALAAACRKAGVHVMEETQAKRLLVENGRVRAVETDRGELSAPAVVNCLGSWAGTEGLSEPPLPVSPVRGQILVFEAATKRVFRVPMVSERAYAVQRPDGRVLVGSTLEQAGFRKELTLGGMHEILCGLRQVAGIADRWTLVDSWSGLRPGTPDKLPILGAGKVPGYFAATGHYRHGILLAPVTARAMTELILNGRSLLNLAPFSPLRFA